MISDPALSPETWTCARTPEVPDCRKVTSARKRASQGNTVGCQGNIAAFPVPPPPPPPEVQYRTRPEVGKSVKVKSTDAVSIKDYFKEADVEKEVAPLRVKVVGTEDARGAARVVTVVHISDTHLRHGDYLSRIPAGDILIHSGDFTNHHRAGALRQSRGLGDEEILREEVREIKQFFSALPHTYKIFVAGNHETHLSQYSYIQIREALGSSVIYLQDTSVTVLGLKIYGSPWTNCRGMGFPFGDTPQEQIWSRIPDDTDVLVTHLPPNGIMDLAYVRGARVEGCQICGANLHVQRGHWGSKHLRDQVFNRVRPMLHLFGHVHECHGVKVIDDIAFSNGAMDMKPIPNVLELHLPPDASKNNKQTATGNNARRRENYSKKKQALGKQGKKSKSSCEIA